MQTSVSTSVIPVRFTATFDEQTNIICLHNWSLRLVASWLIFNCIIMKFSFNWSLKVKQHFERSTTSSFNKQFLIRYSLLHRNILRFVLPSITNLLASTPPHYSSHSREIEKLTSFELNCMHRIHISLAYSHINMQILQKARDMQQAMKL